MIEDLNKILEYIDSRYEGLVPKHPAGKRTELALLIHVQLKIYEQKYIDKVRQKGLDLPDPVFDQHW